MISKRASSLSITMYVILVFVVCAATIFLFITSTSNLSKDLFLAETGAELNAIEKKFDSYVYINYKQEITEVYSMALENITLKEKTDSDKEFSYLNLSENSLKNFNANITEELGKRLNNNLNEIKKKDESIKDLSFSDLIISQNVDEVIITLNLKIDKKSQKINASYTNKKTYRFDLRESSLLGIESIEKIKEDCLTDLNSCRDQQFSLSKQEDIIVSNKTIKLYSFESNKFYFVNDNKEKIRFSFKE